MDRNLEIELDPIARNYLNYSILRYELKVIFLNVVLEARINPFNQRAAEQMYVLHPMYYPYVTTARIKLQAAYTLSICNGRKIHWNIRGVCG